eukprot:483445-Alexandrium_andersonii.AAC.1
MDMATQLVADHTAGWTLGPGPILTRGLNDRIGAGACGHRKTQTGFRRSKLELRGSRKDLDVGLPKLPP